MWPPRRLFRTAHLVVLHLFEVFWHLQRVWHIYKGRAWAQKVGGLRKTAGLGEGQLTIRTKLETTVLARMMLRGQASELEGRNDGKQWSRSVQMRTYLCHARIIVWGNAMPI